MISLLYCGNAAMWRGVLLSSLSAAMHTAQPLDVHILTMDRRTDNPAFAPFAPDAAAHIEKWLGTYHTDSRVTVHDCGDLYAAHLAESPNAGTGYTPYALLRLLVDKLEGLPDRLLYLDTDTVVLGDLAEVYGFDLKGCSFAAARDFLGKVFIHPRYMNTGVLLLDMRRLRTGDLLARARALCHKRRFPFPDQDVLNKCVGARRFLPRIYNEQYRAKEKTVIRHFSKTIRFFPYFHTLNVKPWHTADVKRLYKTCRYDAIFEIYRKAETEYDTQTSHC